MKTKTILFLLTNLIICSLTYSQSSKHLEFKGVPIDGTLNEYVVKMKNSGFTHVETEGQIAMLKGDFAGYKNCIIGVSTLRTKDLVSKIAVIFPVSKTWSTLSSDYYNLKEMLTEKYGKPSEVVEKFDTEIKPRDDSSKMHEVRMNRCKYYTVYKIENGSIELLIRNEGVTNSFVAMSYSDKINSEIVRNNAKDDL